MELGISRKGASINVKKERYIIHGPQSLQGTLNVHGAKNAALPILAASLLCDEGCVLHNCPHLSDVEAARHILSHLGYESSWEEHTLNIRSLHPAEPDIPEPLMREMRSSIVFLGALLAKYRKAVLSLPGGCELGPRPIDLHLSSLEKMGVHFEQRGEQILATVPQTLHGADIDLPFPSVGATENIMLAASLAEGETVIRNAAREPEIGDLAAFLKKAGAAVSMDGDGTVHIYGVSHLNRCCHSVIPDRIVGISYLCCGAITGSHITVAHCRPEHMRSVFPILEEMGCRLQSGEQSVELWAPPRLKAVKHIATMPYPGFPTDALAPIMALCTLARGTSVFTENIFQNRYKQAAALCRMGADIRCDGRVAVVRGVDTLHGAAVDCTDLRGGAALLIAALAAQDCSRIGEIAHIQRGYEDLPAALKQVGAEITLEEDDCLE